MTYAAQYEVFQGKTGEWFWHLKAANGEIVTQSESYPTKDHAQRGVEAAKSASESANPSTPTTQPTD